MLFTSYFCGRALALSRLTKIAIHTCKISDSSSVPRNAHRITGGGGADLLVGGGGSDTFVYNAVADSTGANYDTINYLDATSDKFDFNFAVTGVDASVRGGSLSTASFDGDLASAIGSGQLNASHAVLFDPTTGDLAGHTFLIVDSDCRCQ